MTKAASAEWETIYEQLSNGKSGLSGAACGRSSLRLSPQKQSFVFVSEQRG